MYDPTHSDLTRRQLLQTLGALGVGTVVFQRALAAQAAGAAAVTPEMIQQAEWIAGLEPSPEDRKTAAAAVQQTMAAFRELRTVKLDNSVPPALVFQPAAPPGSGRRQTTVGLIDAGVPKRPDSADTLAFLPVSKLAAL